MHLAGDDTRDLRTLHEPHPAETGLPADDTETGIRRWSNRLFWTGLAILALEYVGSLAIAVIAENGGGLNDPDAQMFGTLAAIGLVAAALGFILLAGLERLGRQSRALMRRAVVRAETNAGIGEANAKQISELAEQVAVNNRLAAEGIVTLSTIEKRLVVLEAGVAAVPDFANGLAKGAQVAASVLGLDKE